MSAHVKRMLRAQQIARDYLAQQSHLGNSGFVVLWKMKPFGWICDLKRPQDKRPGVLAVNTASGQVLQATGGDYWKGATEWSMLWDPAPPAAPQEELCDDDRVSPPYEHMGDDSTALAGI